MAKALSFENVGKLYNLGVVGTGMFTNDVYRWFKTAILRQEDPYLKVGEVNDRSKAGESKFVWALKDITFDVEEGDMVGIIGKNGAGKSTLLKLLSRVTGPTTGTIKAKGRIGSLLEVGTGFHPELTGRENIYMNGAILGMTKREINSKLDEIIDFSGCERYIDTPVKRYSSGMMVRLGFAVAAHLEPEILVVDEVLAVGDAEFQKKAIGKMQDVSQGEGRTVLFVSHNMASIRALCKTGILLENGMVRMTGQIGEVVDTYLESQIVTEKRIIDNIGSVAEYMKIDNISVNGRMDNPVHLNSQETDVHLHIEGELSKDANVAIEFRLLDKNSVPLAFFSPNHYCGLTPVIQRGHFCLDHVMHFPETMNQGLYYGSLYLTNPGKEYHLQMPNSIQLDYEGFPMETGLVFDYSKGNGFLFIK